MNNTVSNTTGATDCRSVKCQFPYEVRVIIILLFTLIFLPSLVGNCSFMSIILQQKRLRRSSTNFSILSLSFANVLITFICIPVFVLHVFILGKWVFGLIACKLVVFVQNVATNAAIFTLVIIGVEKFLVVHFPFHVRSQRTKVRYLVLGGWIIGIIQSSVYLRYRTVREMNGVPYCIEDWPSFQTRQRFNVVQAVALRFVPLTFMICLHVVTIFKIKARINCRRGNAEQDDIESISQMVQVSPQALKTRKKAVVMLVVVVIVSAWTLFPHDAYVCWRMLESTAKPSFTSNMIYIATVWLAFFNSCCQPIIFGLMSSQYRKAAKRALSWKSSASSRNRSSITKRNRQVPVILTAAPSGFT
ncbi:galanin receptor 2a-like [Montipora capricornis]|uniref:galanin receptor 2a-like n=1 Tax=Montipora capricornis TaxID=246305 RepID=UPI0035F1DF7A